MVLHPVSKRSILVQFKCLIQNIESFKKHSWKDIQTWMFREVTKRAYTFPTLREGAKMKEKAGTHGRSLAVTFSEGNVTWEPQKERKNLHLGTQLDRKCKYEQTCMLHIYTFSANVNGDSWLAEAVTTTVPARTSQRVGSMLQGKDVTDSRTRMSNVLTFSIHSKIFSRSFPAKFRSPSSLMYVNNVKT